MNGVNEDSAPFSGEGEHASRDRGDEENPGDEEETLRWEQRLSHFIEMLSSDDVSKRWKAAESLGRIEESRAVDPLIHALEDEDWRVRQKVVWALGYIGDPRAIQPLRRAYRNEIEGVQDMITEALEMIARRRAGKSPDIFGT